MFPSIHIENKSSNKRNTKQGRVDEKTTVQSGQDLVIVDDDVSRTYFNKSPAHIESKSSNKRTTKQERVYEKTTVQNGQDLIILDDDVSTTKFNQSPAKQDCHNQVEDDDIEIIENHEQTMNDAVDDSEEALFSELASCFDAISDDDFEVL